MSQPTPSDRILFLVSGYVLGTLEASESKEFARLVSEDSTILREVDQLQQALEKAYDIVEREPPPQLRERVLAAASLVRPEVRPEVTPEITIEVIPAPTVNLPSPVSSPSVVPSPALSSAVPPLTAGPIPEALSSRSPSTIIRSVMRSLWVAAAAAITALGVSNYVLWRQIRQQVAAIPNSSVELPKLNPLTYTLKSTTTAQAATAKITIYPETLTAQLDTSGLPQLPPGQVYVLWTVLEPKAPFTTDKQGAVLATTFEVNEQGEANKAIAIPSAFQQPQVVAALGVTIESASAPQSHTGSPVLLARLL